MRWLFSACCFVLVLSYIRAAQKTTKDMEALNTGIASTIYALTGRNEGSQAIETTIEEVEDETPYYFPATPKEAPSDLRYYA